MTQKLQLEMTELFAGCLEEELEKTRLDTGGSAHHAPLEGRELQPAGDLAVKGLLVRCP